MNLSWCPPQENLLDTNMSKSTHDCSSIQFFVVSPWTELYNDSHSSHSGENGLLGFSTHLFVEWVESWRVRCPASHPRFGEVVSWSFYSRLFVCPVTLVSVSSITPKKLQCLRPVWNLSFLLKHRPFSVATTPPWFQKLITRWPFPQSPVVSIFTTNLKVPRRRWRLCVDGKRPDTVLDLTRSLWYTSCPTVGVSPCEESTLSSQGGGKLVRTETRGRNK